MFILDAFLRTVDCTCVRQQHNLLLGFCQGRRIRPGFRWVLHAPWPARQQRLKPPELQGLDLDAADKWWAENQDLALRGMPAFSREVFAPGALDSGRKDAPR